MARQSSALENVVLDAPRVAGVAIERPQIAPTFRYLERRAFNIVALGLGDLFALAAGLAGAGLFRSWLKGVPMIPTWSWALFVAWIVGALALGLLPGWGLGAVEELRRSVLLLLGIFAMFATALFLGKQGAEISRLTLTAAFALSLPLLLLVRINVKRLLIRHGKWGLPAVIYGAAETGRRAIRALRDEGGLGYIPVGIFEDDLEPGGSVEGVPVLGATAASTSAVPCAVLAMPDISRHRLLSLLEGPLAGYRRVVIIPDLVEAPSLWVQTRDLGGVLGLEVTQNLHDPLARLTKRALDLTAATLSAPLWVPLCAAVALAVWLQDRHNPFFSQRRLGGDGDIFVTWKFRTMVPDAEAALQRELADNAELRDEWERHYKLRRDPRVTRLGRFLRRTSLDELPQLIHVLTGRMSLVGPRPLPPYHARDLPERVRRIRDRVRPGITGLWQVSGRSESGSDGMERWDTYYVRNWSVWLDLVILVRTIRAVYGGKGAY